LIVKVNIGVGIKKKIIKNVVELNFDPHRIL